MDFPLHLLKFHLVHYKEDNNEGVYVRYLLKTENKFVFTSLQKMGNGFSHTIENFSESKKDSFSKYYPSKAVAIDALLSWIIGFRIHD